MARKTIKTPARASISKQRAVHVDDENWAWLQEYAASIGETTSGAFRSILRTARLTFGAPGVTTARTTGPVLPAGHTQQSAPKTGARGIALPDDSAVEFQQGRGVRKREPGLLDLPKGAKRTKHSEEEMNLD